MAEPVTRRRVPGLIAGRDAEVFVTRYWQRDLHAWSVPAGERLAFGLDDLAAILADRAAGPEFVQIVAAQRRQAPLAVRDLIDTVRAEPARLQDRLQAGDSVIIRRIDRFRADVEQLRRGLILMLGCPVSVNLFAAMTGEPTLGWHRDPTATLAVQLSGTKNWQVQRPDGEVATHTLAAGQALCFPAGWRHCVQGARGLSLSLSFSLRPWTSDAVLGLYLNARDAAGGAPPLPVLPADLLDDPGRARAALEPLLAAALARHAAEFDRHLDALLEQVIASTFDSYRG